MNKLDLVYKFMKENYDYLYLKSRYNQSKNKSILVTGSSHGLLGIDIYEMGCDRTINVSMHSQDLYYSMLSVKRFVDLNNSVLNTCIIILGYYIPFQDLSRAGNNANRMIRNVYFPLYGDSHHMSIDKSKDQCLWENIFIDSLDEKKEIEEEAIKILEKRKQYINDLYSRAPYFNFSNIWRCLSVEEQGKYGAIRAEQHNKHMKYRDSFIENEEHLKTIKRLVSEKKGRLLIIVPPFSRAYFDYINKDLIEETSVLFNKYADLFIDLNVDQLGMVFDSGDFVDTDHLNGRGAYKFSKLLKEMAL